MGPELQILLTFGVFLLLLCVGLAVPFAIAVPAVLYLLLQGGFTALRGHCGSSTTRSRNVWSSNLLPRGEGVNLALWPRSWNCHLPSTTASRRCPRVRATARWNWRTPTGRRCGSI